MKRNEVFRFKQFNVYHSQNAQKVSTDSVLLGAWSDISHAKKILDIGTGCGLLALMCAQRNLDAEIIAVEIEKEFADEAKINFEQSIFSDRIQLFQTDIRKFNQYKFDHIICNPPYFSNSLLSDNELKNKARHSLHLDFTSIAVLAEQILNREGIISMVIPATMREFVISEFETNGLELKRICFIKHHENSSPSLVLIEFTNTEIELPLATELLIKSNGEYQKSIERFYPIF